MVSLQIVGSINTTQTEHKSRFRMDLTGSYNVFKMARDEYFSFPSFSSSIEELLNGLDTNAKLQNLQNSKHLKQVLISKLKVLSTY